MLDFDAVAEGFFQGGDFGFQAGGVLVGLVGDGGVEGGSELGEFILLDLEAVDAGGDFADVAGAFVHGFEEAFHAFTEDGITGGAAEASGFTEGALGHAAGGAGFFLGLGFHTGSLAKSEEHVRELETGGIGDAFLLGAAFAQVYFLHIPFHDLCEENSGGFGVADVAFHGHLGEGKKKNSNEDTAVRRRGKKDFATHPHRIAGRNGGKGILKAGKAVGAAVEIWRRLDVNVG